MSSALLTAWEQTLRRQSGERAVIQAENGAVATFR